MTVLTFGLYFHPLSALELSGLEAAHITLQAKTSTETVLQYVIKISAVTRAQVLVILWLSVHANVIRGNFNLALCWWRIINGVLRNNRRNFQETQYGSQHDWYRSSVIFSLVQVRLSWIWSFSVAIHECRQKNHISNTGTAKAAQNPLLFSHVSYYKTIDPSP